MIALRSIIRDNRRDSSAYRNFEVIILFDAIDQLGVNAIRTLSIDAIQKANSGHPGLPMGCAPMAYTLWNKHLRINPKTDRNWANRDRFVLSAGHGSAMLYALLHLAGYDVSIDDLKNFRQYESKTPGHPEVTHTPGVEATTGPLGQGIAMAVGMAMAEAHLAATYNKPNFPIMDHYTYALCGDGCLMEGISQEAISLAGHLKLGKLILLYDSNDISLDGPTSKAFTEDVRGRFEASNWQVLHVADGNDLSAIDAALTEAKAEVNRPTMIEIKTQIGFGAPNAGTNAVHGAPLGAEGITAAKTVYQWDYEDFTVPSEVYDRFKENIQEAGEKAENEWRECFKAYEASYPELAEQFKAAFAKESEIPADLEALMPHYDLKDSIASRAASEKALAVIAEKMPNIWGGSADLASSNKTMIPGDNDFDANNYAGRNIWFGVREFGMAAAMNGIALHGGTRIYGGTFFVFVDYLRAALRLAAIQQVSPIFVLTHDSIAVGEDGPTHEPIEQLASLRAMPNVNILRPADGNETSAAWLEALRCSDRPTVLVLSRQNLPTLPNSDKLAFSELGKGAYVIDEADGDVLGIMIASGSEVKLALDAKNAMGEAGKHIRVVSMPSMEKFEAQSAAYKESILPKHVKKRLAIEMAASFGWERYVGIEGQIIGIDRFGASAPGDLVQEKFGFTVEHVKEVMTALLK